MNPLKNITNCGSGRSHTSTGDRGEKAQGAIYSAKPLLVPKSKENAASAADMIPYVSAKSWAVVSGDTGSLLFGRNSSDRREMASLTKIMTCYTVLALVRRWDMKMNTAEVRVSRHAALINGTRAEFSPGDKLSVWDLLHAMMLPSGNDAALCLAEHFGQLLCRTPAADKYVQTVAKFPCRYFINEMNVNAKMLGLEHTTFANPHGLACTNNKSTAEDLGRLCAAAMRLDRFRQLVSCREYQCNGTNIKGKTKHFHWTNTHKLLWEGYSGIKTGVTPHAGPCLASSYEAQGANFIVILLNSKSMEARWGETQALVKWAGRRLCAPPPRP